jgi:DNA-binding HxlR family transcriptional regulator
MYTRKTPQDLDCGIEVALKIFVGKWKPCILDSIRQGNRRPSEIHRSIPSATPRVLNMQLRELENYNVVSKKIYPGLPPKVEYSLTDMGRSILPIIAMMDRWGRKHSAAVKQRSEFLSVIKSISASRTTAKS